MQTKHANQTTITKRKQKQMQIDQSINKKHITTPKKYTTLLA